MSMSKFFDWITGTKKRKETVAAERQAAARLTMDYWLDCPLKVTRETQHFVILDVPQPCPTVTESIYFLEACYWRGFEFVDAHFFSGSLIFKKVTPAPYMRELPSTRRARAAVDTPGASSTACDDQFTVRR
jgi:hypothetical protein